MAKPPKHIPNEIRNQIRRDFILGKGTRHSLSKIYKIDFQTVSKWFTAENWEDMKSLFASEDELFVCKQQLVQFNGAIKGCNDAEALLQLVKCKQAVFEIFARIAGLPRAPIGKLEKPKNNKLAELMASAATDKEPVMSENEPSLTHDSVPKDPVIDVNPTSNHE